MTTTDRYLTILSMILYAPNINSGGGLVLLNTVIEDEVFGKVTHLFIDKRCPLEIDTYDLDIIKIEPTIFARIKAEFQLKKLASQNRKYNILCFGNLPSIFNHENVEYVFLQNAYILRDIPLPKKFKTKIRTLIERIIFYTFIFKAQKVIVQTNWMKSKLSKFTDAHIEIKQIIPKLPSEFTTNTSRKYDLIILTDTETHKNYNLIEKALNEIDIELNVCIISNREPVIKNKLIKFDYFNNLKRDEIFNLYKLSSALLMTSSFESFGLPLYEALHFKLKLIAPIKGYTKEIKIDYPIKSISAPEIISAILDFKKTRLNK